MSQSLISTADIQRAADILTKIDRCKDDAERAADIKSASVGDTAQPGRLLDRLEVAAVRNALVDLRLNAMDDLISSLPVGVDRIGLKAGLRTLREKLLGEQHPGAPSVMRGGVAA